MGALQNREASHMKNEPNSKKPSDKAPTSQYQCVSRPGQCKFEWNCGPLCACTIPEQPPRTEQEKHDVQVARHRQACWQWREKKAGRA
jgi:hypothetical protein